MRTSWSVTWDASGIGPLGGVGSGDVDFLDPVGLAGSWADLLSTAVGSAGPGRDDWARVGPVVPGGPVINSQPVSDPKASKARLHLDLWVESLAAAVLHARTLGAEHLGTERVVGRGTIAVMADPEGNEFCLIAAETR